MRDEGRKRKGTGEERVDEEEGEEMSGEETGERRDERREESARRGREERKVKE